VDVEEFEAHLARYGSTIEDWPANLRSAGLILCSLNATAKSLIDEDRALRAIFADQPKPRAPSDLVDRIMLAARRSNGTPH
jgi:hypothetical protein